jgi:hypothetical protein
VVQLIQTPAQSQRPASLHIPVLLAADASLLSLPRVPLAHGGCRLGEGELEASQAFLVLRVRAQKSQGHTASARLEKGLAEQKASFQKMPTPSQSQATARRDRR